MRISVVIPAKDDAPALERCLAALARQTVPADEVVVVDNASVDTTADVARAAGARVVPEPAPGIPAAAATGYDAATGDVVVRCDADTVPPPDWLARVRAHLVRDPGLVAVTGTGTFYGVGRLRGAVVGRWYLWTYQVAMHAAIARPPLWGSCFAMRRDAWLAVRDRVHRDDPELHDDVDLTFALGPTARIRFDPRMRVLVHGRSLAPGPQARRRLVRALRTLRVSWAVQPPWERWAVRLRHARRARHDVGARRRA